MAEPATKPSHNPIDWMELAKDRVHGECFAHLLQARIEAAKSTFGYSSVGNTIPGLECHAFYYKVPCSTPKQLENKMLDMLTHLGIQPTVSVPECVRSKGDEVVVALPTLDGAETYPAAIALDDAVNNAFVFKKINEQLVQQGRDWRTQKNMPVVIEKFIPGGKEWVERAFEEQGIKAMVEQEAFSSATRIIVDGPKSLSKLKDCLDACNAISGGAKLR